MQSDGGDIELVDVTDAGVARIRFHGACVGCPSSLMTLKMGIERNLQDYVPEIQGVEAVDYEVRRMGHPLDPINFIMD